MSLKSFIQTVETDLHRAWTWVEDETDIVAGEVWGLFKSLFTAAEPKLMADVIAAARAFVAKTGADIVRGDLAAAEQAFLEFIQGERTVLVADVQALGSSVLQAVLALLSKA